MKGPNKNVKYSWLHWDDSAAAMKSGKVCTIHSGKMPGGLMRAITRCKNKPAASKLLRPEAKWYMENLGLQTYFFNYDPDMRVKWYDGDGVDLAEYNLLVEDNIEPVPCTKEEAERAAGEARASFIVTSPRPIKFTKTIDQFGRVNILNMNDTYMSDTDLHQGLVSIFNKRKVSHVRIYQSGIKGLYNEVRGSQLYHDIDPVRNVEDLETLANAANDSLNSLAGSYMYQDPYRFKVDNGCLYAVEKSAASKVEDFDLLGGLDL